MQTKSKTKQQQQNHSWERSGKTQRWETEARICECGEG